MNTLVTAIRERIESPERRKFIKYALASIVSVFVTQLMLILFLAPPFRMKGGPASFMASSIAAIPSYFLNRNWVWRKAGKSHLYKEVLPFWIMVLIGLAVSWAIGRYADEWAVSVTDSHVVRTIIISGSNIAGFAILWVLKFIIFNKILFKSHPQDLDPVLDGRTGLPT